MSRTSPQNMDSGAEVTAVSLNVATVCLPVIAPLTFDASRSAAGARPSSCPAGLHPDQINMPEQEELWPIVSGAVQRVFRVERPQSSPQ